MPSQVLIQRIDVLKQKIAALTIEIGDWTKLIQEQHFAELNRVLAEKQHDLAALQLELTRLEEQYNREDQEEKARLARLRPTPEQDPLSKLRVKEIRKIEELNNIRNELDKPSMRNDVSGLREFYEQQLLLVKNELVEIQQQLNTLYLLELAKPEDAKESKAMLKHAKVLHEIKKAKIGNKEGGLYNGDQPLHFKEQISYQVIGDQHLYQELKAQGASDQLLLEMGLVKEKRTRVKHRTLARDAKTLFNNQKPVRNLDGLPALTLQHLKDFLGSDYNERAGLRANVARAYRDPVFTDMLKSAYLHVDMSDAQNPVRGGGEPKFIIHPETGVRDEAIINNLIDRTCEMIQAEQQNTGSYVLYSGANSRYAIFQDLMTQLRSQLDLSDKETVFRLFNENFTYEDAEAFRKQIFEIEKKDDNSALFGQFGLCCSFSPLQASFHESAVDFWAHDKNNGSFDVLGKVILPKLGITDVADVQRIQERMKRIDALSLQLGGRMQQIFLSKEDLDKYTWLSGRNGYKLPSVKKEGEDWVPTDLVSDAIEFYRRDPNGFVNANREAFDQAIQDKTAYPKPGEVYYKEELSNPREPRNDNKFLGQLQARLYLHPELMHSDRIKVNTYYGLPANPAVLKQYQEEVAALAADIMGTSLRHKASGKVVPGMAPEIQAGKAPLLFLHQRCRPEFYQEALRRQAVGGPVDGVQRVEVKPVLAY